MCLLQHTLRVLSIMRTGVHSIFQMKTIRQYNCLLQHHQAWLKLFVNDPRMCRARGEKSCICETAVWLNAIYAGYSWFHGPPPIMIGKKNNLGRHYTPVISATCTKNHNVNIQDPVRCFQCGLWSAGHYDVGRPTVSGSGLRRKRCASVFGQQTNIPPVVCTVNHIMLHDALQQTCRLLTPPTVTH